MKNSDVIFHLVEKYGKTDPEMSKRYNVSPETKYIHLYDNPSCGNYDEVNLFAFDPKKSGAQQRLFGRTDLPWIEQCECSYRLDGEGERYDGKNILSSIVNTLLMERTICSTKDSETYKNEVELVKKLRERCYRQYHPSSFSEKYSPETIDNVEKAERKILDSIEEVVKEKYNGHLEFPAPILLHSAEKGSMFICADSLDSEVGLNFYNSAGWSDMITPDRYGKYFLSALNDLIGGKNQIHFYEDEKGQMHIKSSLSIKDEDIENISPKEALKRLLDADGEINFIYRPYTDYIYNKLHRAEKPDVFIVEYSIHTTSPQDQVLGEKMNIEETLEFCKKAGIDLTSRLKEHYKEDIEENERRFTYAFKTLLPTLYDQATKDKVKIENFDSLLEWYNNKQKIENSLSKIGERKTELSERTGQKVSSPAEPTTHDSNSPTPSKPNGRNDGGR